MMDSSNSVQNPANWRLLPREREREEEEGGDKMIMHNSEERDLKKLVL